MRNKQKLINLYQDRSIGSVKIVFSIANEEDLNQCWDYFETHLKNDNSTLQTLLTILFNVTDKLLQKEKSTFFEVILEQTRDYYYFTIWNEVVSQHFVKIIKSLQDINFKNDAARITIKIDKIIEAASCPLSYVEEELQKIEKKESKKKTEKKKVEKTPVKVSKSPELFIPPYAFLNSEDLEELLELCDDMVDVVSEAEGNLTDDSYLRLRTLFSSFSLTIGYYEDLYEVSDIMKELSVLVSASHERFVAMNSDEIALVDGFVNNLDRWAHTVFVKGGADIHFMDDSLKADLQTIKMLVEPEDESSEEDLDDIFDF